MGLRRKKAVQQSRRTSSSTASRIYSRENVGRYSKRARKRRRGRIIRRSIVCSLLVMLITAGTATAIWFNSIVSRLNNAGIITDELRAVLADSDVAREPFSCSCSVPTGAPARPRTVPTRLSWRASTPRAGR